MSEDAWRWVGLVVATGLISAAWTTFWGWISEARKTAKSARFVALEAALAFERYAIACWPVTYSGDEHFRHTHEPFLLAMPALEALPASEHWRSVDVVLANEALSFLGKVQISDIKSTHSSRFEGNPFDIETEAASRGQEAWSIAEKLRQKYNLPMQVQTKQALSTLWDKKVDW